MIFQGKAIQCQLEDDGIAHLTFDIIGESTNVFNKLTLDELAKCLDSLKGTEGIKGLLLSSKKEQFILGADIFEFLSHFKKSDEEMAHWLTEINAVFSGYEDLPYPTVTAINGFAFGGGFEICLATTYRVASTKAKVGLLETKLGIIPGWGGTVRLPRLCGADQAIEWITSGKQFGAEDALKIAAVDAVVQPEHLIEGSKKMLKRAIEGQLNWKKRVEEKVSPLKLNEVESMMTFETAKGFVAGVAGPHYPAPVAAISLMQKAATLDRSKALPLETKTFVKMAKSPAAESLVTVFLGDQYLKKTSKKMTKEVGPINQAAVLGAGIMGGGIAYQSSSKGTPILMKDINDKALNLGLDEAAGLLQKQLKRKKIDPKKMGAILNQISPTLSYGDFKGVDIVVEAVVENPKIKKKVLAETEGHISENSILASNTSTISITSLAAELKRPDKFCGMHFFNPVHRMPLVEIIRGEKTSDETVAKTVAYALKMGKTPIVVNDCPGFLVNRILFPYLNAFIRLVKDGVDFKRIDKVMEKFGWPMGPAYLSDVVGLDTCVHAGGIMAQGFPDRMTNDGETISEIMVKANRLGQKNGLGFYEYKKDKKGKLKKNLVEGVYDIIKPHYRQEIEITDEEIVERMMLPMIFESARCLEDKIVKTPAEVDMGLILGLGFPPFRAGTLKYADSLGATNLEKLSKKYEQLGKAYELPASMAKMIKENKLFYPL
ncbi:fatty acid oxidation complex subunit alpha FadB [Bacteriovoracales bacterium]|nr:fatty acid oxidation complex subunit alpha FadB [Bacteriovoracales bacterium]